MKNYKNTLNNLPWGSLVIIVVWLVVFAVLAARYLGSAQQLTTVQTIDKTLDKNTSNLLTGGDLLQEQLNQSLPGFTLGIESVPATKGYNQSANRSLNLQQNKLYTQFGELYAIYDENSNRYTLLLNQLPLSQIGTPLIRYAFTLQNNQIIIILDAEKIGKNQIYTILALSDKHKYIMHEVGNYQRLLSANLNPSHTCVNLKFNDERKYSDQGDYQVYQYCGTGYISKIMDMKPEDYYKEKYANLNPSLILQIAQSDHCLEHQNKSLIMNYRCSYGIKYCYMLKSISHPNKNRDYITLANACKNRIAPLFFNQQPQ